MAADKPFEIGDTFSLLHVRFCETALAPAEIITGRQLHVALPRGRGILVGEQIAGGHAEQLLDIGALRCEARRFGEQPNRCLILVEGVIDVGERVKNFDAVGLTADSVFENLFGPLIVSGAHRNHAELVLEGEISGVGRKSVGQERFGGGEFAGLCELDADGRAQLPVALGGGGEALENGIRLGGFLLMAERDSEQTHGFGLIGVGGQLGAKLLFGGGGIAVLKGSEGGLKVRARSGCEARGGPDAQ
ncbi:MAG TPA: hypothetical protein VFT60_05740 [Bryobacteraceae bacterium]|nr:hypothetical protein [Bryobacteraceae bacterium]